MRFPHFRHAGLALASALLALPAYAQPVLVQDIRLGSLTSVPRGFQVLDGELFFTAQRSDVGNEPFHYNGQYTALATDVITAPEEGSNPQGAYVPHQGAAYFVAAVENAVNGEPGLWRFDGVTTTLVWRGSTPSFPTSLGDNLYFVARHPTAGGTARVWRWDGHDNYLVTDIPQGARDPQNLTVLNGALYFTFDADGSGAKLWRYAPGQTAAPVSGVAFTPASVESRCGVPGFDFVHAYRGALYFTAPDYRLYRFDGTSATAISGGRPKWMGGFGGAVFYTTGTQVTICGGHPQHTLWGYDGAPRKVATLMNFGPDATDMGTGLTEATPLTPFHGSLYYRSATDLWRLRGSSFERVSNANLRGNDAPGRTIGVYQGRLFFGFPLTENFNEELFAYDGNGPVYQTVAALGVPAMGAAILAEEEAALAAGAPLAGTVANEGVETAEAAALSVGPNPARHAARVHLNAAGAARVEVFDLLGRRMATLHDGPVSGTLALPLNVSGFSSGVYVVRASSGAAVQTARLVVQR